MAQLIPSELQNVGGLDRRLRGGAGVVLAVVAVVLLVEQRGTLAAVTFAASGGLLFNAVTGVCGVNALLGVDTCSRK